MSNPAGTVDGGIPRQFHIKRPRPAATDPHRWAA
jgi:hypothetical protein